MNTKKPSKGNATHFFWESKANKNRSRFNLLLLEFGEYLLEDLSAYYFPIPTHDLSTTFEVKDSLKIQGRLKLSTRSLIFEPVEARYPIIKFPYKSMPNEVEVFNLKPSELSALSVEVSGFFTFNCLQSFEMKENNKIAPYKMIDYTSHGGHRSVFALVHGDITALLVKIEQLRHILKITAQKGQGMGNTLLQPFIEQAQLWTLSFDTSLLVNFHEKMLFHRPIATKKIKPLIIQPGSIMVTESRVYFQPSQLNNIGDSVLHFEIRTIQRIFKRRYLLQQTGLEFMLQDNTSHLFVMDSVAIRDTIYSTLMGVRTLPNSARSGYSGVPGSVSVPVNGMSVTVEMLCRKWQRREISNFEYLMLLNSEADRSVNDLTQYPVFPHIIADYTSKKLKLDSPATFRDLSKPMGALNLERLQYFKQRLESMPPQDKALGVPPPFLYGTHYSTPGYVLHYLVRVAPEYMLCLQNGKFDAPDRMFHNIASTWQSCLTNPTDLKELIPEFFTGSGEFLSNFDDLDLGHLHTGERLNDVVLPPWADSPRDFLKKHQKALECEYVSEHLHEWIDLIFGYKQTGPEALKADNLYYFLTYEGAVDIDSITDMRERDGIIMQIQEFGQTPKQLFTVPHPCRNAATTVVAPISSSIDYNTGNTGNTLGSNNNDVDSRSAVSEESVFSPASRLSRKPSNLSNTMTTTNNTSATATVVNNSNIRGSSADSHNAQLQLEQLLQSSEKLLSEKNSSNNNGASSPTGSGNSANEDIPDISIVHLDAAFKLEVDALEAESAQLSNKSTTNNTTNSSNKAGTGGGDVGKPVSNHSSRGSPYPNPSPSPPPPAAAGSSPGHPTAGKTLSSGPLPVQREKKPVDSLLGTVLNFFNAPARPKSFNLGTTNSVPANPSTSGATANSNSAVLMATPLPPPPAVVEPVAIKDTHVTDPNVTRSLRFNPTTAPSGFFQNNARKMVMVGGESYYWHSKAVTGVSAMLYAETSLLSGQSTGRYHRSLHTTSTTDSSGSSIVEATHAVVATVARDANLKVSRIEQTIEGGLTRSGALQVNVVNTTVAPRRTTAVSGSSLSAVLLLHDKNHIVFSSWDNNIYGYSVSHAHAMGKVYAHDDAVTCLSTDKSNKFLLSGSLDTSVKLWALANTSGGNNHIISDGVLVQPTSLHEFNDSDSPIHSVAIDDSGRLGAAGNAEGIVTVYDLKTKALLYSLLVSPYRKVVNCLRWVPENNAYKGLLSHTDEKLLCGTEDGALVCLDRKGIVYCSNTPLPANSGSSGGIVSKGSSNDLYSVSSGGSPINMTAESNGCVDSSVSSLECDGRVIYTGHADGTIRCYIMTYHSLTNTSGGHGSGNGVFGDMVEVYRHTMAHTGRVNTLSLTIGGASATDGSHAASVPGRYNAGQYTALLVSGGEDCCVKLWRIYFSGDY